MTINSILNKELTILYLLSKGSVYGRLKLHELLHTARGKHLSPIPFRFVKRYGGHYSFDLQRVLDNLVMSGLVKEERVLYRGKVVYKYELTEKGKSIIKLFEPNEEIKKSIDAVLKNSQECYSTG